MVKVIYFNQWVSSISLVLEGLKKKYGNDIRIIASSKNKNHAYKSYVDEFIVEDWEEIPDDKEKSMENYVEFLLKTFDKYHVDIFFVKKYYNYLAKNRDMINRIRTFSVLEDYKSIDICDSKSKTYDYIKNNSEELKWLIPHYVNSDNIKDIIKFIESKHKNNSDICLKFDSDEGGASFRHIVDKPVTISSLYWYRVNEITTQEVYQMLFQDIEKCNKLLFMDMLDSPEISVERIFYNSELSDICMKIGKILNLRFAYNVQFRREQGHSNDNKKADINNLRLLEVNPRMSGGVYLAAAYNLNIAEILLLDMLNRENEYTIDKFIGFEDKFVTHLEMPVKL